MHANELMRLYIGGGRKWGGGGRLARERVGGRDWGGEGGGVGRRSLKLPDYLGYGDS